MAEDSQTIQKEEARKETPRHREGQRHHHFRREHAPRPAAPAQASDAPEKVPGLDDEETEQDRAVPRPRGHRGGRPEKKVYEEWASDPYCE